MLQCQIKIAGILLFALAAMHLFLPRYFHWPAELRRLSLINRQIFIAHCAFIVLMLVLMGALSVFYAPLLVRPSDLGKVVLGGLAIFWTLRAVAQWFFYSSALWRGQKFNTCMHVLFSVLWVYFAGVYGVAFLRQ